VEIEPSADLEFGAIIDDMKEVAKPERKKGKKKKVI
jgi:hypothetical protein